MRLDYLEWDSDFFKLRIGRIFLLEKFNEEELKKIIIYENYNLDLIYVIDQTKKRLSPSLLEELNGVFIDEKVLFEKVLLTHEIYKGHVSLKYCESSSSTNEFLNLALESGKYSRFKRDPFFKKGDFERLYEQWVSNSLLRNIANEVIAFHKMDKILGFVTVKLNELFGTIGLIGVDKNLQGKGIGTTLVKEVESFLIQNKIQKLQVSTQRINFNACKFYEKQGFEEISSAHIYHFWLNYNKL